MLNPALIRLLQAQSPEFFKRSQPLDPELEQRRNFALPTNQPPPVPTAQNPQATPYAMGGAPVQHRLDYMDQQGMAMDQNIAATPPPAPKEEQGYFQKLLNDPTRMALLRYGTGVLGGQQPGAAMDSAMTMRSGIMNPADPYTLAPGQTRFSGSNQKVASVPALPTKGQLGTDEERNHKYLMALPAGSAEREEFRQMLMRTGKGSTKAIQNFEMKQAIKNDPRLTPEERTQRLAEFKDSEWAQQHVNLGGYVLNPGKGISYPKTPPPQDMPEFRRQQKYLEGIGAERGKAQGKAMVDLPKYEVQLEGMLELVDQTLAHPGLPDVIGLPDNPLALKGKMPGTDAAGFDALHTQVHSKAFLEAFQDLKGGGHITEIEGEKATDAIIRANKAISETDYIKAMQEFKYYAKMGLELAKKRANPSYRIKRPEKPEHMRLFSRGTPSKSKGKIGRFTVEEE